MQRLAIFGGTFNPPHQGHLHIALAAQQQYALDQVLWVPNYAPLYRTDSPPLEYPYRVEMVARAIAPYRDFQLSTVEGILIQPAYAIDLLKALEARYPDSEWFWILGLDAFQRLHRWHQVQYLVSRCTWLVAPRAIVPPTPPRLVGTQVAQHLADQGMTLRWHLLNIAPLPISSSLVRDRRRAQLPIENLVPSEVWNYIDKNCLYLSEK